MSTKEKAKTLNKIESDLVYLYSLKSEMLKWVKSRNDRFAMGQAQQTDPNKSSYSTNVIFAIIMGKLSEIATGIQEYDFIPEDGDAEKNLEVIKWIWTYVWLTTNTDDNIYKAFESALKHWDWYIEEGTRKIERRVNKFVWYDKEGKEKWNEETVTEWDWIYQEYIPIDEFYHDWITIDDANIAIKIKQWDRTEFINRYELNVNYKNVNEKLPKGRRYYITDSWIMEMGDNVKDEEVISELSYYNKSKDEYIILANWVEVYKSHIPYPHKELPFIQAIDIMLEDRYENMGEYDLLDIDEAFKDAIRALKIDVIKESFGVTIIDEDVDLDNGRFEFGLMKFVRGDPNSFKHFSTWATTNELSAAENKADEDLIIKSGHDFRNQLLSPDETAEKTRNKKESAKKRINLMLKKNNKTFFSRLARLRMANIKVEYSTPKKISLKWYSVDGKWIAKPVKGGWGTFTTKPDMVNGEWNVLPINDSILGESSERDLKVSLEFLQLVWNMQWPDWAPIIDNEKVISWLARKMGIDKEDIIGKGETNESPESIMKKLKGQAKGESVDPTDPSSSEYIPPEQRAQQKNVQAIGGWVSA